MGKKRALITGISGQDGAYLTQFLLKKGFIDHIVHRKNMKQEIFNLISILS